MRRDFKLPLPDVEHLDSLGYQWETVNGSGNWVIIHGYPVPAGYNLSEVSVGLCLSGYPMAQIDMVYFLPDLQRLDRGTIRALHSVSFDGKQWQRWSRHRTAENPWRPGIDDIGTQLLLVTHWLERELK